MRDSTLPARQRAAIEASANARGRRKLERLANVLRTNGYVVHSMKCPYAQDALCECVHGTGD